MQVAIQATRPVHFGSVKVGDWFKELGDGPWYLKTTTTRGTYQSWGSRHEPSFQASETVVVPSLN